MSAFLLGRGFRADMGTCIRKLVLLKLIDACEDDGSRIFPAMETVARAAQCSKRQVQREIRAMIEVGLLRLVREGGSGRRSTNEYHMDLAVLDRIAAEGWEAVAGDTAKGDTVSPLEEGSKGDTGDTDRVTPATPKGDNGSHTTPPDSSSDSSGARAGASASGEEGEAVEGGGGRKAVERAFERAFREWPTSISDSRPEAWKAWSELSPGDREAAAREASRYVEACRTQAGRQRICSHGVYLRERRWERLPEAKPAPVASRFEPAFGPAFAVAVWRELMAGPQAALPPMKRWEEEAVASGHIDGAKLAFDRQAKHGWPELNRMFAMAGRGGTAIPAGSLDHLKHLVEAVPVDTETFAAWRLEHELRGWPWADGFGFGRVMYFPRGGPAGLDRFAAGLAEADGKGGEDEHGNRSQAAE